MPDGIPGFDVRRRPVTAFYLRTAGLRYEDVGNLLGVSGGFARQLALLGAKILYQGEFSVLGKEMLKVKVRHSIRPLGIREDRDDA